MTKMTWLARVVVIVALGFTAGAPLAQTTTKSITTVRHFEVISVDGNKLVVRDERGTNELTVPDDFRFTVDGKKMAVSELKPGMKGTATVTTKTTVTPVVVTEFRDAVVLSAGPKMVTVRGADGVRRRFSQDELDKRGIQIVKNGQVVRVSDLHAAIVPVGNDHILEDLKSANGTFVNGTRMRRRILQHGDVVELGAFNLRYLNPKTTTEADLDRTMLIDGIAEAQARRSAGGEALPLSRTRATRIKFPSGRVHMWALIIP